LERKQEIKATFCVGRVCSLTGLCIDVHEELLQYFPPEQIAEDSCMGLCEQAGAFSIGGNSYAGEDLDRLNAILNSP